MDDIQSPSPGEERAPTPEMPEAGKEPSDPLRPDIEEENLDFEDDAGLVDEDKKAIEEDDLDKADLSDNVSELSDVDEAEFEDFDPANIAIEDRPAIAVDESNVGQIGKHKRKRAADEEGGSRRKREGRREKPKRLRKRRDGDDDVDVGDLGEPRERKKGRSRKATPVSDDENLSPEEREFAEESGGAALDQY